MINRGTLDNVLNCSIKHWTRSAWFTDVITPDALKQTRFVRPVAGFLKPHLRKSTNERRIPPKAEALPPPGSSDSRPQHSSLAPSSDKVERCFFQTKRPAARPKRLKQTAPRTVRRAWIGTDPTVPTMTPILSFQDTNRFFRTCFEKQAPAAYFSSPIL